MGFMPIDGVPVHFFVGGLHQQLVGLPSFALFPFSVRQTSLVMKDLVEVCPLSRGVVAIGSTPIHSITEQAFAFSTFLCPHLYRLPLRVAFPRRESYGVTVFRLIAGTG